MNCHHFRATQKSIPDAQELIWLGGGVKRPPPCSLRVNLIYDMKVGVAFFGFFGNCFSIYILSCEDMKNSFNHLLIVLACLDNLFLVFCLLDYSLGKSSKKYKLWKWLLFQNSF